MIPNCCTFLFSHKILPKFYMVILLGAQSQDKHTVKCIATYDSLPAHFHMCFSDLLTTLTCHVHDFLSSLDKSCHRNPYLRTSVYQAQGFCYGTALVGYVHCLLPIETFSSAIKSLKKVKCSLYQAGMAWACRTVFQSAYTFPYSFLHSL